MSAHNDIPLGSEDQWSPLNLEGKKQYDRDFLLQLQSQPTSICKPPNLPNMDAVKNKIEPLPDQWSPLNLEGKKQYDRDFLLQLQCQPTSICKPPNLPNMDAVKNKRHFQRLTEVKRAAPIMSLRTYNDPFCPNYVRGGRARPPPKKEKKKNDPKAGSKKEECGSSGAQAKDKPPKKERKKKDPKEGSKKMACGCSGDQAKYTETKEKEAHDDIVNSPINDTLVAKVLPHRKPSILSLRHSILNRKLSIMQLYIEESSRTKLSMLRSIRKELDYLETALLRTQGNEEMYGRSITEQLKTVDQTQKAIVQKLIADVIFHAKHNQLTSQSSVSLQSATIPRQLALSTPSNSNSPSPTTQFCYMPDNLDF